MIKATSITHSHDAPADTVTLTYDDRFRRRMVMTGDDGLAFLLDLPEAVQLHEGTDLLLEDGRHIRVHAALEDIMQVIAKDPLQLMRTAWHIGNRHLPCEIHADRLVLRWDHVIADMLEKLGCEVKRLDASFNPEGGAYGHGKTHSHDHDDDHDDDDDDDQGHSHGQSHD